MGSKEDVAAWKSAPVYCERWDHLPRKLLLKMASRRAFLPSALGPGCTGASVRSHLTPRLSRLSRLSG